MRKKMIDKKSQDPDIEPREKGELEGAAHAAVEKKSGVNRRKFLIAGSGAAAAALITSRSLAQQGTGQGGGQGPQGPSVSAFKKGSSSGSFQFREPGAVSARLSSSGDGSSFLVWGLSASLVNWKYTCDGQTTDAPQIPIFNYNVPGVTFFVDPGTNMMVRLMNNLGNISFPGDKCEMDTEHAAEMKGEAHACPTPGPTPAASPAPLPAPKPGCFNHTNLHTHGLMVSPCSIDKNGNTHCGAITSDKLESSSDDVLVDIPPGGSNLYRIVLPNFHAPGTHWYHSHLHGASGYQVSSGMAGAIIVREPYGQQIVPDDRDKIFLMQEVIFGQDAAYPAVYTIAGGKNTAGFLINGQCQPTLSMVAGQTQRWRFINGTATPRGLMKLRLVKCSDTPQAVCDNSVPPPPTPTTPNALMYLIAVDGISFYGFPPQPVRAHLIGPGNRADFLINIPRPGKYKLVKDAFPTDAKSVSDYTNVIGPTQNTAQVLAYIEVNHAPPYLTPEKMIDIIGGKYGGERAMYLQPIGKVDKSDQQLIFFSDNQSGVGGVLGGRFQINNNYYPCNSDFIADVNTAQEVTIQNQGPVGAGQMPHTFHIHVNPFQMVGRTNDFEVEDGDLGGRRRLDPNDPCNWMWMDTLALPPNTSKVRSRFLVYNGEYVSHCHLLIHEDVGMMVNVKINGKGIGPNQPVTDYPPEALACIKRTMKTC
ncbi:MAG TPA: multicopper oxidase family protein [Pyrinomonadaceae bacterium]|jgi:FtsP/CotA-like multicopper oxidase with cupredoxin domain